MVLEMRVTAITFVNTNDCDILVLEADTQHLNSTKNRLFSSQ